MRVTIACLPVSGVVAAQDARLTPLEPHEKAPLERVLDDAARRRRSIDPWVQWDGHCFQGPDGRTCVRCTLRIEVEDHRGRARTQVDQPFTLTR